MQKEMIESDPILKLSFDFSLQGIEYCGLPDLNKKYVISKQLLKAATKGKSPLSDSLSSFIF
jgi:hypothetical protein